MYKAFLIKYGEISLKGKNRYLFENALVDRIRTVLKPLGEFRTSKEQGRLFIECPDEYDYEEVVSALKKVFGICSFSPVAVLEGNDWEDILEATKNFVGEAFSNQDFTFKVEAKRADKKYKYNSPEICSKLGAHLLDSFPELKVDVRTPEVRVTVELRSRTYIYAKEIKGQGGMPVGSNGKAMLLLSGGIDSPVAGYMVAKRGVALSATYFHAPPYTSERAKLKVVDLAKKLAKYTGPIQLNVVNFTDIQLYIYDKCPHEELTIIMRRYMMKISEELAGKQKCLALVTGESIGQVASQTIQSLAATNEVCETPVFRPLVAFDKQDIVNISIDIDTYETSILPYEDCCTIFVAKHPVTKPDINRIKHSEINLEEKIDELVKVALENVEIIEVTE